MFFRWDWLRPVLTAPIVPTLGPVHPHVLTVDLFEDTLRAAVADRFFLRYDKDRRWSSEKDETVLRDDVVHQSDHTLVPTLTLALTTSCTMASLADSSAASSTTLSRCP